jgi:CRP/FNR family transcriptional regulator
MTPANQLTALPASAARVLLKCSSCALNKLCLPTGLDESDIGRLDTIIGRRRRVERGENLFSMDQPFKTLYAIPCARRCKARWCASA